MDILSKIALVVFLVAIALFALFHVGTIIMFMVKALLVAATLLALIAFVRKL